MRRDVGACGVESGRRSGKFGGVAAGMTSYGAPSSESTSRVSFQLLLLDTFVFYMSQRFEIPFCCM